MFSDSVMQKCAYRYEILCDAVEEMPDNQRLQVVSVEAVIVFN